MELREMYEPSLMRGRDFKINDKITIHMPSVGDIIDYGEQKYFQLVYLFCSTSSDYKAQLDSVGIDWQKISDFEMFRQLFIGNKDQDMSILLGDMDTSGFMMAKDNISGEIVLHNRLTDTRMTMWCMKRFLSTYVLRMELKSIPSLLPTNRQELQ